MKKVLRIAIAQINCTVGDLEGNARKISDYIGRAEASGAGIVSFPELSVTGYPPEDLLLKESFVSDNQEALKRLAKGVGDITAVVGFIDGREGAIYNAAAVIRNGTVRGVCRKEMLPNYGVFDEKRYFTPGTGSALFSIGVIMFGVNICEDIWHRPGPLCSQAANGAGLIININSSPYHTGKLGQRESVVREQAKQNGVVISYTNLIGGQDELVFDGNSMIVDERGTIAARAGSFEEDLLVADVEIPVAGNCSYENVINAGEPGPSKAKVPAAKRERISLSGPGEIYKALTLGLKDYVTKNGFKKVVIGLSGGVDSALVAALAADALGKENVLGVFMPTRYSSELSLKDAGDTAKLLGINFNVISIDHIYKLYLMSLESQFALTGKDITEENLQARIRGNILMALSNKFGYLVLTTGNKSEMSTGYATLYGDMAGGFAVIKDVPKTLVYELAAYRNGIERAIPESVMTKAPTAELRANQKDQDTLPPYDLLDRILKEYVEEDKSFNEIVSDGFSRDVVAKVIGMVDRSEYKRRQSPPGIKITPKAFGKDRRMPITNRYK